MTEDAKKYCRCLTKVGAKHSASPYAVCSRIRPVSMKEGCAVLYNYKNMPYALRQGAAALHNIETDSICFPKQTVLIIKNTSTNCTSVPASYV